MIAMTSAINGIKKYIYTDMLPHLPTIKQILLGGYIELAQGNAMNAALKLRDHPAISILGVFDESGNVDETRLYTVLFDIFSEKRTIDIPMIGTYTFSRSDVDKLFDFMRSA